MPKAQAFKKYSQTPAAMASKPPSRVAAVVALLACAAFGGYGTFGAGFQNGMFDTITKASEGGAAKMVFPGGPTPYRTSYTGIAAVDDHLVTLVAFFTFIIDAPQTYDITLSYVYLMAHFWAGMCLLLLEGTRNGNRGKVVSWYEPPMDMQLHRRG